MEMPVNSLQRLNPDFINLNKLKTIIILIFILLSSKHGYGQISKMTIGYDGGLGLGLLWGNDIVSSFRKPILAIHAGGNFHYRLSNKFVIAAEAAIDRKGQSLSGEFKDINGNSLGIIRNRSNFLYATVSALGRYSFGLKKRFYILAGPFGGYLIQQYTSFIPDFSPRSQNSNTNSFKRIDAGITSGLGYELPVSANKSLTFELRNSLGLRNISKTPVINHQSLNTNSTLLRIGVHHKIK
jgi:hypothetical protein